MKLGTLVQLGVDDAGEMLTLQRAAYVTEAQLHDDVNLPPLTQTLEEIVAELERPDVIAWGFREDGRLVGSIRALVDGAEAELRRSAVAPDRQGNGIGTALFTEAERRLPPAVETVTLFTGEFSVRNIELYRRLGFAETHRSSVGAYELVHMAKSRSLY